MSTEVAGLPVPVRSRFTVRDIVGGHDSIEVTFQAPLSSEEGIHGSASAGGDDPLINAPRVQFTQQASHTGSDPDGSLQSASAVVVSLSIPDLNELVGAEFHATADRVMLHPLQPTGHGQQFGIQSFIPEERQIQLLKGCVECRTVAIHFGVSQGAVDIPEHRLQ